MFQGLDHLALAVRDTPKALELWHDRFGFPILFSERVNGGTVLLTHLDLGNTQLQLAQPLVPDHPLARWMDEHGEGLHHFCLRVENIDAASEEAKERGVPGVGSGPHQGTQGQRALFLDRANTDGVQVELCGA